MRLPVGISLLPSPKRSLQQAAMSFGSIFSRDTLFNHWLLQPANSSLTSRRTSQALMSAGHHLEAGQASIEMTWIPDGFDQIPQFLISIFLVSMTFMVEYLDNTEILQPKDSFIYGNCEHWSMLFSASAKQMCATLGRYGTVGRPLHWPYKGFGVEAPTYQVGAHFEAHSEPVLMAPSDFR